MKSTWIVLTHPSSRSGQQRIFNPKRWVERCSDQDLEMFTDAIFVATSFKGRNGPLALWRSVEGGEAGLSHVIDIRYNDAPWYKSEIEKGEMAVKFTATGYWTDAGRPESQMVSGSGHLDEVSMYALEGIRRIAGDMKKAATGGRFEVMILTAEFTEGEYDEAPTTVELFRWACAELRTKWRANEPAALRA